MVPARWTDHHWSLLPVIYHGEQHSSPSSHSASPQFPRARKDRVSLVFIAFVADNISFTYTFPPTFPCRYALLAAIMTTQLQLHDGDIDLESTMGQVFIGVLFSSL